MLVLTRKQQQQIQIGEGVTITILKIKGNTVRIGIDAPSDVRIVRGELELNVEETPEENEVPARLDEMEGKSENQETEPYQVVSFRIPRTQSEAPKHTNRMHDFIAMRNSSPVS